MGIICELEEEEAAVMRLTPFACRLAVKGGVGKAGFLDFDVGAAAFDLEELLAEGVALEPGSGFLK